MSLRASFLLPGLPLLALAGLVPAVRSALGPALPGARRPGPGLDPHRARWECPPPGPSAAVAPPPPATPCPPTPRPPPPTGRAQSTPVTGPSVLCSALLSGVERPATTVHVLRTEALGDGSDWRITTLLVFFPPHAFTPRHVHGGALTAYVLSGRIRSQLDDGPVAELWQGDTFYEAVGTIHSLIENTSDEHASVLATIVHPPGAALTTMLPD